MKAVGVGEALFVTVAGGLLVIAARRTGKWVSSEENREMAKTKVRQKLCGRHEWETLPDWLISRHAEECRKCGARR